jgi:hypothetical protein
MMEHEWRTVDAKGRKRIALSGNGQPEKSLQTAHIPLHPFAGKAAS